MDLLPQSVNARCYIEDGNINIFTASNGQENMASASISIYMLCLEVKMDGYAIFLISRLTLILTNYTESLWKKYDLYFQLLLRS